MSSWFVTNTGKMAQHFIFRKLRNDAPPADGLRLCALEDVNIQPGQRANMRTGWCVIDVPAGYVLEFKCLLDQDVFESASLTLEADNQMEISASVKNVSEGERRVARGTLLLDGILKAKE